MAATRSAAMKLDWAKISSSLGLKGQTAASLTAFKNRNDEARRKVNTLAAQPQSVDFDHYRSVLGNKALVDEIEGQVNGFKPKSYDLSRQFKAIDAFETQAIKSAHETTKLMEVKVKEMQACVKDIKEVRGFDELSIEDMVKAEPRVDEYTAKLVYRGRWMVPGFLEKWGDPSFM